MQYLTTIRQTIQELDPQGFKEMQVSGELGQTLSEYAEQVGLARNQAARQAKLRAIQEGIEQDSQEMLQIRNLAAMTAQEIEMSQIIEELHDLYGQSAKLMEKTKTPLPATGKLTPEQKQAKQEKEKLLFQRMTKALAENVEAGKVTP